ncbi:MAG: hypothetical protein COU81_00065 [Candidatus Portnoybacteria bacterium CG10_big_fil_rev_8_21_14_0_10_36_7]|uniref:Uncharacterized protein n=1 Tax=Candidatus Portnoybacteria bacterium CG10_big_fil_rev_8_21_14_0_10_36_7 TaxID=1974812 RepID=A0A2M8KF59_9BACT|nr:MAG: hypothetical protein COU81_00065 [Candidatus Portnoybacteria bacterium CG10_big_fil_rev_8_21_14_0_10_36_7]
MLKNFRERFLREQLEKDERHTIEGFIALCVIIVLLVANIVYLNIFVLKKEAAKDIAIKPYTSGLENPQPTQSLTEQSLTITDSPTPTPTPQNFYSVVDTSAPKDYFIPLGSGTNNSTDWTDITGVQTIVDFGQYPNIKEVKFEASVTIRTGFVLIRLYNVTDKHTVWNSEMTLYDKTSAYLVSSPLSYDTGSKTYQVQMRNQLNATATLVQAKIHVILK